MKILGFIAALALAWFGYRHFTGPIAQPPGVLVPAEPQQHEVAEPVALISHGDFQLRPLARFSITARVLHRRNYAYDAGAKLSPTDLALGWGSMSDTAVLDQLKISQSMRFYWYKFALPPPIPQVEIARQSTNVHIIPADRVIARHCRSLRRGELVRLEGQLVEATGPEIGTWRSSLSRDDTGKGACELLLVERVETITSAPPAAATLVQR